MQLKLPNLKALILLFIERGKCRFHHTVVINENLRMSLAVEPVIVFESVNL
ncbi:hypothetical protein PspKH34_05960 [Parageobacillus sp. KH3-4]|nr:hypothetical protein PspKH34_05960 [Parageobacillus sp. KH3-4]